MKQNPLKTLFSTRSLVLLTSALIAGYLVWNTAKVVQKNYGLQQEVGRLQEEVRLLELENENLKLSNEYYKTDAFLELEAKRKFNLVSKGENVLILPNQAQNQSKPEQQNNEEENSSEQKSNFGQWIDFLLGHE
ncbi:hypothetical protein DYH10_00470 [Candidatus Saccharibacteria bacterium CPR2]|nr:hypothetical protein [Candidatus Saccharibacteria bacterium CPR2]